MSRVQLALNVDDLEAAITFYSRLFNAEPAKRKPGYANFAIADPPLKLVLLENPRHRRYPQPSRCGSRLEQHRACRNRPVDRSRTGHREGDRHHVLLCHPGQGVGDRPGWGTLGGLYRAGRLRDLRQRSSAQRHQRRRSKHVLRRPSRRWRKRLTVGLTPGCVSKPRSPPRATQCPPNPRSAVHRVAACGPDSIFVNIDVCRICIRYQRWRAA
ncbi:hypothetical protein CBG40_14460 [Mycobacterium tuberculosis]|nr:hypothetical protein CBG40_14460 [Mycobacterium tuberculosis]